MQPYPGTDPATFFNVLTPAAGTGIWPTPQEAQGGDKRQAAQLMAGVESLTDRTNFLAWRTINIVDGHTSSYTTNIALANAFFFNGTVDFRKATVAAKVTHGGTFYLGDPALSDGNGFMSVLASCYIEVLASATLEVRNNGALNVDSGGLVEAKSGALVKWDSGSALTTLAGSTVTRGGTETRTGSETLSGNTAYTKKRIAQVAAHGGGGTTDPAVTIDGSTFDIGELPADLSNLGAAGAHPLNLTITENVAYAGATFSLKQLFSDPTQLVIVGGSHAPGTSVATFNSHATSPAENGSVEFYYDSAGHIQVLRLWAGSDPVANPLAQQG